MACPRMAEPSRSGQRAVAERERERERGASVLLCAAARQGATRGAGDTIASTRGCPECLQAGRLHGSAIPRAAGGRLSSDVVESEHRAAAPRRRPRGWLTGSRRLVFTRSYVRRRVRVEIYDGPRTGITPARRIVWAAGTLVQAATGATARPPRSGARRASGATGRRASVPSATWREHGRPVPGLTACDCTPTAPPSESVTPRS